MSAELVKAREDYFNLIREAFNKIVQIVLQSRITFEQNIKLTKNEWFHLETNNIDIVTEELIFWKSNLYLPLRIKIYLEIANAPNIPSSSSEENQTVPKSTRAALLEEWKVSFEVCTFDQETKSLPPATLHKRLVVLMRTIYAYVRLMPAYKLFRNRIRNKVVSYQLRYKITRPDHEHDAFVPEFGSSPTMSFHFHEIMTPFGVLNVVVKYCQTLSIDLKSDMKQILVENYEPQKLLQRRQSAPAKTSADTVPQSHSQPLSPNVASALTATSAVLQSSPIAIQHNSHVSRGPAEGTDGGAAQSAPIAIPTQRVGRSRVQSVSGNNDRTVPLVNASSVSSSRAGGGMPSATPAPMPTTASAPRAIRSSSRGASLAPPLDLSSDATPPFSVHYLSTSGGDKASGNPFVREGPDAATTLTKGTTTSFLSSTPPLTIGSPPASFSIFKPFKSPRFSSTSGEKYTPFQLSISPFRDSPLAVPPATSSSSMSSSPTPTPTAALSSTPTSSAPTTAPIPSHLLPPSSRHQAVQIYPILTPSGPASGTSNNTTNLPIAPTTITVPKSDGESPRGDLRPIFDFFPDNDDSDLSFECEEVSAFAVDSECHNAEVAQFIHDCQMAPPLVFSPKESLSSQIAELDALKDIRFLQSKAHE